LCHLKTLPNRKIINNIFEFKAKNAIRVTYSSFCYKNKNNFVIQCFMHNLIISNVLNEESDAKKHVGSKEKLAFAEFRVLYLWLVKHRTGHRPNMKTSFIPFAATYYVTLNHCSSLINFSM
jgi:hypothetical protein